MSHWTPDQPYNDLPPLPPEVDLESRAILKGCITARAALSQVLQAGDLLPNPAILINTIPLLEAQASSEIENIVTTADRLFRYAGQLNQADPATKEALRYRAALYHGFEALKSRPLCTSIAVDVCREIKGVALDVRKTPGTKLVNDGTGAVIYTPPEGEQLIRNLLKNIETFIHADSGIDPLIKMAVMHYQFEAIHPFIDGNGRTGRVLNLLYLIDAGVLNLPILYLSGYIIRNKREYYQRLLAVTSQGDWEGWILYMLRAIEETAQWTIRQVRAIRSLIDETANQVKAEAPQLYSTELIETIFVQPYCRIGNLVEAGIAKRETASRRLRQLAELGILQETRAGREKLFINVKLLNLFTDGDLTP